MSLEPKWLRTDGAGAVAVVVLVCLLRVCVCLLRVCVCLLGLFIFP
jgi:hypothetical protein